ncbi:MAG TPA: alpha/beta hydrolase [Candidatus Saccharimonadales bacterium]|jgi:pimeloyl-ACP methyl ester carboxylesterase|nr:alpha/beta hydrolase [Candidatus Saccharimonadales bacterium]
MAISVPEELYPPQLPEREIDVISSRDPTEPIPIHKLTGRASIGDFLGFGGMSVNVGYWEPVNPVDFKHDERVGLEHGWGAPPSAYESLAKALALRGVGAFTIGDSRSFGLLGDLYLPNYFNVAEISSKVAWTTMKIVERLTEGERSFVMYGHSMGGQTATNVSDFGRGKIRGLIVDGSCGAEEHDFIESWSRAQRFTGGEFTARACEIVMANPPRLLPDLVYHALRNLPRTLLEGINAGSTNLHESWGRLGKLGVRTAAIQSARDVFSPADAVERDSSDVLGAIHRRDDPESGHLAPQLDPEGTADIIIAILDEWSRPSLTPA